MRRPSLDPLIFNLRLSVLLGMYREQLRRHAVGELLAGAGIAVGVALVFGVLVANTSILDSARETLHDVYGKASLELAARSSQGFSETLAQRAGALPGVKAAAFLLKENAILEGPAGDRAVQLVGLSGGLIGLQAPATENLGSGALLLGGGVGLPSGVAGSIGARTETTVRLLVDGYDRRVPVRAVLGEGAIGTVASSAIVVALLPYVQRWSGQPGQVTNVLIRTQPGRTRQVARELRAIAGDRLDVLSAEHELELVKNAAAPTAQSTTLFVAISAIVGWLLAFNAMLVIAAERRRTIADLRIQGYDSRQILTILASQAGILGLAASIVGIAVGALLADTLLGGVPDYIAIAFPMSGHQTVHASTALVALGCGVLASMLASMLPAFDLRPGKPVDAALRDPGEPGQSITPAATRHAAVTGAVLVALLSFAGLLDASLTVAGGLLLALAALCFIPLTFRVMTRFMRYIARRYHGGMLAVATIELEGTAIRSAALAGIAALAIYGSFAVGGAGNDLVRGLDSFTFQTYRYAPVWVLGNEKNPFATDSFHAGGHLDRIRLLPQVASVTVYQGAFLDDGPRMLWIRAQPPNSPAMLPASELLPGSSAHLSALLSHGDWSAVSSAFADEHDLRVGSAFVLATPAGPARFRVAALTTNLGWPPGAITISTTNFRRWWTTDPAALAITLKPGVSAQDGRRAIRHALGTHSGLQVLTASERISYLDQVASQGLQRLSEISSLLLLTAALALAAALSRAIYQRRARLAALKADGFDRGQLWRGLLLEGAAILAIGSVDGILLGVYGHFLADRYLRLGTGFPVPFSPGVPQALLALLVILGIALTVIALPGYSAAGITTEARPRRS